ncbi:MAG: iron-containing alcohol dehydrogenase [Candidatus Heimdallarchaeota archaeon]|nr:iron-containing alcohol dehydrogenase [Candidatus Heimdallarchaeota archaeon]
MWDFTSPRKVIFGEDALEYLSELCFENVFIVTDPTIKTMHLEKILAQLGDSKVTVFDKVSGEPSLDTVKDGACSMIEAKPDVIIALGGGSVLDSAKGMFPIYSQPDILIDGLSPFEVLDMRKKTNCILINIPTTSGTGADVTWAIVLTDLSEGTPRKISLANRELVADITILDPVLTKTMTPRLIAGTGMDAMCHAIDGYLSTWRNDFSDALSLHAFKLLWNNLPIAFEQAKVGEVDFAIREKLHNSATMAGWGFGNSQIILSHSLAHTIGAVFKIPHSVCIGAMCWYSLMFNQNYESERICDLAKLVGYTGTAGEIVTNFVSSFKELLLNLELPLSLLEMKVTEEEFQSNLEDLIAFAENDSGTLSNPRSIAHDDFITIFKCVFEGKDIDF